MVRNSDKNQKLDWLHWQLSEKKSILNGISDAIMLLDAKNYKILDVNNGFLQIYKTSRENVLGKTCHETTHHLMKPCHHYDEDEICPLEASVSTGDIANAEHVHRDRDGKKLYFEITAYPLKTVDGKVTRIVHLSRDVTDRRRAEEALKEKVTRSEHLANMGQFVAEITHEIKNPLMMIGGFARQLLQEEKDENREKKLTIIREQTERLEKLLIDLREYYLPRQSSTERINVKEVLERVFALVKNECEKKQIHTRLRIDGNSLIVNWDADKLEQVFITVIKNSIEATSKDGNLSIHAGASGDKIEVTISDDGCGIPQDHMDSILECFFTTKSNGTGLGLCISKKYIDQHNGSSLSVKSTKGKGTTVVIGLPTREVKRG